VFVRSEYLSLRHLASDDEKTSRLAFAITRKVGTAVTRNRIRRRIRGALQELDARGRPLPHGDSLIIVSPKCVNLDYQELVEDMDELLGKLEKSTKNHRKLER
jgi:ribonuclease P protein component